MSCGQIRSNRTSVEGFTLIELISVLVLAGILAAGASALMAGRADFSSSLVKDQLIASIRLAQQSALSKTQGSNVSHTIRVNGGNLAFDISHPSSTSTRQVNAEGASVTWSSTALSGSCSGVTNALPHTINFDSRGDTDEVRYCISGVREFSVCVSSLGYAYEGACDT